jgi:arylsulfatase A-like enzyme
LADKQPNIVFILTDNLGYGELGRYGGGVTRDAATQRIDALAKEGMRLLNANMETRCTPSRSSLMTGRWAIRLGTHSVPFGGVADGLTQWEVTIGGALSDAGYATGYWKCRRRTMPPPADRSLLDPSGSDGYRHGS